MYRRLVKLNKFSSFYPPFVTFIHVLQLSSFVTKSITVFALGSTMTIKCPCENIIKYLTTTLPKTFICHYKIKETNRFIYNEL